MTPSHILTTRPAAGLGSVGRCSCGWESEIRQYGAHVEQEFSEHLQDVIRALELVRADPAKPGACHSGWCLVQTFGNGEVRVLICGKGEPPKHMTEKAK